MTALTAHVRRRRALAAGLLSVVVSGTAACAPSRDEQSAAPTATVVVDLADTRPGDTDIATSASASSDSLPASTAARSEASGSESSTAGSGSAEPALSVPFADFFDVDPFGSEPVRGSGCGLDRPIGAELPDGLWRGFVRSFDGLWIDAASSLQFDLACVYAGDAAADAEREWRDEHPGEKPIAVPDGFLVNNQERVRTVPLAGSFVQVDAQWNDSDECAVPERLPPSGETQAYLLLDSWMLVNGGEAQWVVTTCPPR